MDNFGPLCVTLIGLVTSIEFQQAMTSLKTAHRQLSHIVKKPVLKPMLEYEWCAFVRKSQHKHGRIFTNVKKPIAIFINGEYLGNEYSLVDFLASTFNVRLAAMNWYYEAQKAIVDIYERYIKSGRKFVYFTISINEHVVGHLIFMLYADLVPKTCKNFIKKCKSKHNGYKGALIHRIVHHGWIQFGGYKLQSKSRSCENYKILHNKRGVLSMCNNGCHTDNTTQFFVTLEEAAWMDYKYVAFGQLIQGEKLLRNLEYRETFYECPRDEIRIIEAGEITLDDTLATKNEEKIDTFIKSKRVDFIDPRDSPSILLESHYVEGLYCYEDDNETHLPMHNLSDYLTTSATPTTMYEDLNEDLNEILMKTEKYVKWFDYEETLHDGGE